MSNTTLKETLETLRSKVGSKADYVPRTLEEARENFIDRAEATVGKLRARYVRPYRPAPMATQQLKTKKFCVKIGYGGNNAYMANTVHTASQVLKYDTAEQAASDIENLIIPVAKEGAFDEALEKTLQGHKERSEFRQLKRRAQPLSEVSEPSSKAPANDQ